MRARWATLIGLLVLPLATACGEPAGAGGPVVTGGVTDAPLVDPVADGRPPLEPPVEGGTLRAALAYDLDCWTGMSGNPASGTVFAFVARGLYGRSDVGRPPEVGVVQPDLAADLPTIEEDGRVVVVRIREGLRFSDGAAVTARDVKATFELMLDPRAQCATIGPLASGLYDDIAGAPERAEVIREGGEDPGLAGIEVRDEETVAFRLRAANPAFVEALALPWAFIRPAATPPDPAAGPPRTVAPYRLERADGRGMVAVRADGWDANAEAGVPDGPWRNNVDALEIEVDVPGTVQRARIAAGELDLSLDGSATAGASVTRLARDPAFAERLHVTPDTALAYAVLRADRVPFNRVDARRAVNLAVDRAAVVAALGGGRAGSAWSQILPGELLAGQPEQVFTRDRAAARVLVAETGLARRRVVLAHSTAAPGPAVARVVARGLRDVGVRVRLSGLPPRAFALGLADAATAWDIAITDWQLPYADAGAVFTPLLRCGAGGNAGGWCDPAFDAEVADVAALPLGPERAAQFAVIATATAVGDAPWLVLAQPRRVNLVATRVGNVRWGATSGLDLGLCFIRT